MRDSDKSDKQDEASSVEKRVDELMDPSQPTTDNSEPAAEASSSALPPINILTDPKTAPEVSPEVLKQFQDSDGKIEVHRRPVDKTDSPDAAKPVEAEKLLDATATPEPETSFDDPKTAEAVEDITSHESDAVLAAEDTEIGKAFSAPQSVSWRGKLKGWLVAWWENRRLRWATLGLVAVIIIVLAILPPSRSFALNLVGVRGTATATVLDNTTSLPLQGVKVQIGSQSGMTDSHGNVKVQKVKLGSQSLTVYKVAFAPISRKVSISWGSNNLGQVALTAVGTQYHFKLTDYVSGLPVNTSTASSGQANALADKQGNVILTVVKSDVASLPVTISDSNYRSEVVNVPVGTTTGVNVALVPVRKEVFVSKQSGRYDLYSADVDGKNQTLLLAGTGNENDSLTLVSHPNAEEVAMVSTRDNIRDSGGYLEQTLTLINATSGAPLTIDHSDRIQIVDWVGDWLVYAEVHPGASAASPSRYQLISYNYTTNKRLALAQANYFNDIVSAQGSIYYATSNNYSGGVSQFARINADGTQLQVLLTNEIWNIIRVDYNNFALSSSTTWYNYQIGSKTSPAATTSAPANTVGRNYIDSPDASHSLWADNRDGKGALVSYNISAQKDTVINEQGGLAYPVRWLNGTTVIYRVNTPQETADYVVSTLGGSAKKIVNVTNTAGIDQRYFY